MIEFTIIIIHIKYKLIKDIYILIKNKSVIVFYNSFYFCLRINNYHFCKHSNYYSE